MFAQLMKIEFKIIRVEIRDVLLKSVYDHYLWIYTYMLIEISDPRGITELEKS